MPIHPLQDNFNRGEISPRLRGRPTLEMFRSSVAKMVNFDPLPQGGYEKRLGTMHVGAADAATNPNYRLFEFTPSAGATYAIEVTEDRFRVWDKATNSLVDLGSGLTSISNPATTVDVAEISMVQSNDVAYFVGGGLAHTLSRYALDDWQLEEIDFADGPFLVENVDQAKTITVTVNGGDPAGTYRLKVGGTFDDSWRGSHFRLREADESDIARWSPTQNYSVNDKVRASGNVYIVTVAGRGGGTSEAVIPSHDIGEVRYGDTDVATFKYQHSGFAVFKVNSIVDPALGQKYGSCTLVSTRPFEDQPEAVLPDDILTNGTYKWAQSEFWWSISANARRTPDAVSFYQERLAVAKGQRLHLSRTGNFKSFRDGTNPDDAVSVEVSSDQFNNINALTEVNGYLMAVTDGGLARFSAGSGGQITPDDVFQRRVKKQAMSSLAPLDTDDSIFVFPEPSDTVFELAFSDEAGGFLSPDAAIASDHIIKNGGGVTDSTIVKSTAQTAKFQLRNGQVGNLIFDKYQQVNGWSRHDYGGKLIAIESIGGEPWMVVRREVDGVTQYYIERQASFRDYGAYDLSSVVVDHDAAAPTATLENMVPVYTDNTIKYTGSESLAHLEGEEVQWYSMTAAGTGTVTGGVVAGMPDDVYVGLPVVSELETLRVDLSVYGDGADGDRPKRISGMVVDALEASGLKSVWRDGEDYLFDERDSDFTGAPVMKEGLWEVPIYGSWEDHGAVSLRHEVPYRCTIRSIIPKVEV